MTKNNNIDILRYTQIVESYGVNPARWPNGERQAALGFAAQNSNLTAQIRAQSEQLDQLLNSNDKNSSPPDFLMSRIMKSAQEMPQDGLPANDYAPVQTRWKSLAATLLLTTGLGFGIGATQTTSANADEYQIAEALLASNYDIEYEAADWTEFSNE